MPLTPTVEYPLVDLSTNLLPAQSDVEVIALTGGEFVIAWIDDSGEVDPGTDADVVVSIVEADGTIGAPGILTGMTTAGEQTEVALAPRLGGGFFLAFIDDDQVGQTSIKLMSYYPWGEPYRMTTVQNDAGPAVLSDLSIATDPTTGDVLLSWLRTEGDVTTVMAETRPDTLFAEEVVPEEGVLIRPDDDPLSTGQEVSAPEGVVLTDGAFRWALLDWTDGDLGVEVVRMDADGSNLYPTDIAYTTYDGRPSETPVIAPMLGGSYALGWITEVDGLGRFGRRIQGPDGSDIQTTGEWQIPGHDLRSVAVVGLPDGGAYFVMHDLTSQVLRGFRTDGNGDLVGDSLHALFAVDDSLSSIDMAVDAEGVVALVWTDDFGVHGASLDTVVEADPNDASVLASELAVPAYFQGTGTFTVFNDVDGGDDQLLDLTALQLDGFSTLALVPDPFDPLALSALLTATQLAALSPTVLFDLSAGDPNEATLLIDMEDGGDVDMRGFSFAGSLTPVVSLYDIGAGGLIHGSDADTVYGDIGAGAFIDSGLGADLFMVDGASSDFGALVLDGDDGGEDTLLVTAIGGEPTVRDFSGATVLGMEALLILGLQATRFIIATADFEVGEVITDPGVAHVFELLVEDAELDLLDGAPLAQASGALEIYGTDIDQVFTLDDQHDALVDAGGGDDLVVVTSVAVPGGALLAAVAPLTHTVLGGDGHDAVALARDSGDFALTRSATGFTLTAADLVIELEGVEELRFDDRQLFLEPEGLGGFLPEAPLVYDPTQDFGTTTVSGDLLQLQGNDWAALEVNKTITADTVVAFDAAFTPQGELFGFGFDGDLSFSPGRFFTLGGTDGAAGVEAYAAQTPGDGGVTRYEIPVGAFYTGAFQYMFFTGDDDAIGDANTVAQWESIRFFERAALDLGEGGSARLSGYGAADAGDAEVSEDGDMLALEAGAAKAALVSAAIGPDTWLRFTFEGDPTGGFHGIGFDDDLADDSPATLFQLFGADDAGAIQALNGYDPAGGAQDYAIRLADFFTGDFAYLTFINADTGGGGSVFSDIALLEAPLLINNTPAELQPYAGGQDQGTATVLADGSGFTLSGNPWKAAEIDAEITRDTWLVFDLLASDLGEVTAIGLDDDLQLNAALMYQLGGADTYGRQAHRSYVAGDGLVRFEIHVGADLTGPMRYLTVIADDDADASAEVAFSNIAFEERPTVDLNGAARPLVSYGGSQDQGSATPINDGAGALLEGNAWKALAGPVTVTADTWVSLDFFSDAEVEVAGFGFDADLSPSVGGFFQLAGTDSYGVQDFHSYAVGDGWVHYDIHVGAHMEAGLYEYLSLVADDDAGPAGRAMFENIAVYEGTPQLDINGTLQEVISYGGAQDQGTAANTPDGLGIALSGNAWKAVHRPVEVDADTWLAVTFEAQAEGEVFAIGLDTDLAPNYGSVWQLSGTDHYGLQAENDVAVGDGPVRKYINVGQALSGSYDNIVFIADDDAGGEGVGVFSEVEVLQAPTAVFAGYGGAATGLVQALDGGGGVRLSQNANRSLATAVEVDADTVLHFEFKSYEEGEVHGIGLDTDDSISNTFWQLLGTQAPSGLQTHNGLYEAGDGWVAYDIAVGEALAPGVYDRLTLLMDSDGAGAPGDSWFRNVWFENAGAAQDDVYIL